MERLGPYEIRGTLGHGGGGEVYRAWDPRLEREVALKILHERFESDPERVRSFIAEGRAASALTHPNIVTIFDAAIDSGTPYIVSEIIDGRSLRDELARGALPLRRVLDLATQIADGLAAAHEAGIKHGDLKPENVMVTRTGRAKLVDFGLTRAAGFSTVTRESPADPGQTQTVHGLVAGTVPYMSPEQARGLPTDARSDQFSFGLILIEMVTGRPGFRRDTPAATLDAIIHDDPPALPAGDGRVPAPLRWIAERCLAKDPAERYGATADLHRDLKTLRDRLADVTAPSTARGTWTRGRAIAIVAAAVLVSTIAGAWLGGLLREPAGPDLSRLGFWPLVTAAGYEGLPAWSPTGPTIAYAKEVDGTLQIFARKIGSSEHVQLTHQPYDCTHPFWSADGLRVYFISLARRQDGIWSVSNAGGASQIVLEHASRGALSHDGRTLAFLRDETRAGVIGTAALWIATPAGAAPWTPEAIEAAATRQEGLGDGLFIEGALSFSPDSSRLGVLVVPGLEAPTGWQFWIVPLPAGAPFRRLASWSEPAPRISNFTWQPDSRHVVLGVKSLQASGSQLWMADLDRDRAWPLTRGTQSASYPSASPDGDQIVFSSGEPDYDISLVPLDTCGVRRIAVTARNESDPVFAADDQHFAYVTDRRGVEEIWMRSLTPPITDVPHIDQSDFGDNQTLMLSAPAFSADGEWIAFQRNGYHPRQPLRIWWAPGTKDGPATSLMPPAYVAIQGEPSWSPEGPWIAYSEWRDNQWRLMKAHVGSNDAPQILRTDGVSNAMPRWSGSGLITWETEQGLQLVSADGQAGPALPETWKDEPWLALAWTHDGRTLVGIRETGRRLSLMSVAIDGWKPGKTCDLGPSPVVNNPVKGLSLSADGRTALTAIANVRGELWMMTGVPIKIP